MTQPLMTSLNTSVHPGYKLSGFIYTYNSLFVLWLNHFWIMCTECALHMHFKNAALSIFVQYMGIFPKRKLYLSSRVRFLLSPGSPT